MANNAQNIHTTVDGTYVGHRLILFTGLFIPVQVIAVTLRYVARWMIGAWGPDDYIVLVSLMMQVIIGTLCIEAVNHAGVGFHILYLDATDSEKLIVWGKYLVVLSVLYFATVNLPKLAIVVLYHRLFPNKGIRIIIYILASMLIGLTISNTIADLAACQPFEANWDPTLPGATCFNKEAFFIWGSIPNIVTDVAILVLPMPIVWKLHTAQHMKIGLSLTFAVGSFGLVTSIIRFTTFFQNNSFTDGTFTAVELLIWTQVEAGVYLISACLPTYKVFLDRIIGHTHSTTLTTSVATGKGYGNGGYRSTHGRQENFSISDIPLKGVTSSGTSHSHAWAQLHDESVDKENPNITVTTHIHMENQSNGSSFSGRV